MSNKDTQGVIVVDHGSKRAESNAMLDAFVDRLRQRGRHAIVEPAHMELAEPSIAAAFDRCVQQGATRVVIAPFFFWPGVHITRDIPQLVADAAAKHDGVTYTIAEPVGDHPLMCDVIDSQIEACLNTSPSGRGRSA